MRIRKNVWTLPAGDPTLSWYAKAVDAMRALPITDPRSWRYQAAIHGYPGHESDPLAVKGETLPSGAEQRTYWQQCQHGSSFFLPWHRMFLLHFERIVAAQVAALNGPTDWALPYWDYSTRPEWGLLPVAFQNPQPGAPASPLYVKARNADANSGKLVLGPEDVDVSACLTAPGDTDPGGFFGAQASAHAGDAFGAVEQTPHNQVHVQIGSDATNGWMLDPDIAALDPIFWLHHSNIDRLWQVWLQRDSTHQNLTQAYWLSGVSFDFHDMTGAPVTMRSQDVLDMTQPALDYGYEDTSDPLAAAPAGPAVAAAASMQHELVGATPGSVDLGEASVDVDMPTPVSPATFARSRGVALAPGGGVKRVVLRLENVTSSHPGPMYDVYLNVPKGDAPKQHPDLHVGRAAMFGIAQASRRTAPHGGSGQTFAFNITRLYNRLAAAGAIDPQHLRVSFVPVRADRNAPVRVGRVSLYFA